MERAGVINVRLSNGDYLVTDKDVTVFSWSEEELAQRGEAVPFSLQDDQKERAGKYTLADQPFDTYVVEDGRLITGQNSEPGSAKAVTKAVVKREPVDDWIRSPSSCAMAWSRPWDRWA
jgi:hypothetical protein